MSTLRETFLEELGEIFDAEKQLVKTLPKLAQAAQDEDLRRALEEHLEQTEGQIERLEQVFEIVGEEPKSRNCKLMEALIKAGDEGVKSHQGDAALICAVQKMEHYEIASYGSLQSWARLLGEDDAADLLEETLDEERDADEQLTDYAENNLNIDDEQESEQESQEPGEDEPPQKSFRSKEP